MNVPTVNDPARQSSQDKPDCRKLIFKDHFARSVKWRPRLRIQP
jgi:hypothetical protein